MALIRADFQLLLPNLKLYPPSHPIHSIRLSQLHHCYFEMGPLTISIAHIIINVIIIVLILNFITNHGIIHCNFIEFPISMIPSLKLTLLCHYDLNLISQ